MTDEVKQTPQASAKPLPQQQQLGSITGNTRKYSCITKNAGTNGTVTSAIS